MFNIISGNFEITKQKIAELKKEINELRQSIEHTDNILEYKVARVEENLGHIFFFYLGFLSRTFMIHRTAGEGGGYFFNPSLPLPPASQTFVY